MRLKISHFNANHSFRLTLFAALCLVGQNAYGESSDVSSSAVKSIKPIGQLQTQFGYVHARNDATKDKYHSLELRRSRLGFEAELAGSVRAQIIANLVPGAPLSMRSAYLQWHKYEAAKVKFGYEKPMTSIEENTSSSELLTVERSLINNLVAAPGSLNGAALDGSLSLFSYGVGVYTDAENRNDPGRAAKYLYNASLGLDFAHLINGVDSLLIRGNYIRSHDAQGVYGSKFKEGTAVGTHIVTYMFDLRGEYMQASKNNLKVKGWYIMPSQYISERVQAVWRLESAKSNVQRSIAAPARYTQSVPDLQPIEPNSENGLTETVNSLKGNDYRAVYFGLNIYFPGRHSHKLMTGVELAELNNTAEGKLATTTIYTAWRVKF